MVANGYKWYRCHSNVLWRYFVTKQVHTLEHTEIKVRLCSTVLGCFHCMVYLREFSTASFQTVYYFAQVKALEDRVAQHQKERDWLHQQHREVSVWTHFFNIILQE